MRRRTRVLINNVQSEEPTNSTIKTDNDINKSNQHANCYHEPTTTNYIPNIGCEGRSVVIDHHKFDYNNFAALPELMSTIRQSEDFANCGHSLHLTPYQTESGCKLIVIKHA